MVGDEIVLASDVRDRVNQAQLEGREVSADNECGLIESILFEKLLLHNARLDSLEVTDAEVMGNRPPLDLLPANVWLARGV